MSKAAHRRKFIVSNAWRNQNEEIKYSGGQKKIRQPVKSGQYINKEMQKNIA